MRNNKKKYLVELLAFQCLHYFGVRVRPLPMRGLRVFLCTKRANRREGVDSARTKGVAVSGPFVYTMTKMERLRFNVDRCTCTCVVTTPIVQDDLTVFQQPAVDSDDRFYSSKGKTT